MSSSFVSALGIGSPKFLSRHKSKLLQSTLNERVNSISCERLFLCNFSLNLLLELLPTGTKHFVDQGVQRIRRLYKTPHASPQQIRCLPIPPLLCRHLHHPSVVVGNCLQTASYGVQIKFNFKST